MSKLPKKIKNIAITGGLATGKSTVLKIIKDLGYKVFSCDDMVKHLYNKKEVIKELNFYFGKLLITNNNIDKNKIIENIIPNKKYKMSFYNIFYPFLRQEIKNIFEDNTQNEFIFFEVPLLYEANFQDLFDKVILIYADKTTQLYRAMFKKGYTFNEVNILLNNQILISDKIFMSDYIIISSNMNNLTKQVKNIISKI